jgi:paraquat-inducible protein B
MASEGKTSYTKIGFIVVAGIVAVAGSLFYFGGVRGNGDLVYAETCFDRSVSGLSIGSAVNFRGVKIGEVKEISFVGNKYHVRGDDNLRVYIRMGFPRSRLTAYEDEGVGADEALGYMVESVGIRATVSASGVTGLSRIELDAAPDFPAIQPSWTPEYAYIPPKPSFIDNFSDSATRVMDQINRMDIAGVWSNVSASVESLAHLVDGTKAMLESGRDDADRILGNISAAAASVRGLVDQLHDNPSLLVRERREKPLPETE